MNVLDNKSTRLQVDYESEEEEEDKDDQCEPEEENAEEESLREPQPEPTRVPGLRRTKEKREGGKHEGDSTRMRVNAVLQSNPAIQRYCFDQQQELWCEVGITAKRHIPALIRIICASYNRGTYNQW